jgi:hypothetical protein
MAIFSKEIIKTKTQAEFEIESAVKSDAENLLLFG